MAESSETRRGLPWLAIVPIVLLLIVYVGAYVRTLRVPENPTPSGQPAVRRFCSSRLTERLFWPAVWVEEQLTGTKVYMENWEDWD